MSGSELEPKPGPADPGAMQDARATGASGALDSDLGDTGGLGRERLPAVLRKTLGVLPASLRDVDEDIAPPDRIVFGLESETLPTQIGRYRLAGELARGGAGSIHKAYDIDLGREVALKVLQEEYCDDPDVVRRFIEEAQIGGQLQHPGVVPVHEMGVFSDKRPYFSMKLVKGQTLAKHLEARTKPSEDRQRFLGIFLRVSEAIAYAHARGVVHRDLKPLNIMVGAFGEVQVMDWGVAKVLSQGPAAAHPTILKTPAAGRAVTTTRSKGADSKSLMGTVLGTPAYMSPEQARGEIESIDERSDVFGLGAILCEILTGAPPYTAQTLDDVHRQAANGTLQTALARIDACGADPEVTGLAKRCLAFDAEDRPRDAGAVAREIGAFIESLEERARQHQIRAAKARTRTVALCLLVVAIAVAGVLIRRFEMERRDTAARLLQRAMSAAERSAGQAEAASTDLAKWSAAVEAARAARDLATGDIDSETAAEAKDALGRIEESARVRRLLARLEETEEAALSFSESSPGVRIDQRYQDAFRDYFGGSFDEVDEVDATRAASAIRETGHAETIARGLDDWALVRWALGFSWSSLADLSIAVSPEPWRVRAWQSLRPGTSDGLAALEAALRDSVTPAALLTSCAGALLQKEDFELERRVELAESLLRRALDREPGGFRANERLARLLSSSDETRLESLRYWTAARALRPGDPGFATVLGQVYERTGQNGKALLEFADGLRDLPGAWRARGPLALLERDDIVFTDPVLDDFLRRIEALPASVTAHIPETWEILAEAQGRRYRGEELRQAVERAARRVQETGAREPHVLLMLSRLLWASGRPAEAIRVAEEAELLSGSSSVLRRYRRSLAPRLVSCASLDAAIDEADRVQVDEGRAWSYRVPDTAFGQDWRDASFDDSQWERGTGNLGWMDSGPSNRVLLRQRFVLEDPGDFLSLRLVVSSSDHDLAVYANGHRVDGELAPKPGAEGGEVREFDLGPQALRGTNLVLVEASRRSRTSARPLLQPTLEWERRSAGRAACFSNIRDRLAGEEEHLRDYLDGRWLQVEGDLVGAVEKLKAVLAHERREVLPFTRLWECLRESRAEEEALAEVRREIDRGAPNALLPGPPKAPGAVGTEVTARGVTMRTSPFLHLDPRVSHAATRWRVLPAADGLAPVPAVDLLSYRHLTELALPPHALEPNERYVWRAHHIGVTGVASSASDDVPFTTGDWRVEAVPIDLEPHFNRDVVADTGDSRNDSLDDGLSLLAEEGYGGDSSVPGMPTSRRIQVHQLGDYRHPNAIQIKRGDLEPVRIAVPPRRFQAIRFLVVGGHGNASVPVVIEYSDGTVQRDELRAIDWVTEPTVRRTAWGSLPEGVQRVRGDMARVRDGQLSYGAVYGVFDVTIEVDRTKAVHGIALEANHMDGFFDRTRFNLFAVTGVCAS